MFTVDTTCTTYITPQDQGVVDCLVELIDGAKTSVRFMIYGCTHPKFFDAVKRAVARGVDTKGIFDHTQACGPKEAAALHGLFLAGDPRSFRIGTSEVGHQIVHLKGLWINLSEAGGGPQGDPPYQVPVGQQFDSWQDAVAAGYPVTWSGSWNFSESATSQVNNVDIMPGVLRAQSFQGAFDALWRFIDTHEQQYQVA